MDNAIATAIPLMFITHPCIFRRQLFSRNVRHDQPVRHARLEMLEYAGLSSRHADRQRLAVYHAKLDDIGALALPGT